MFTELNIRPVKRACGYLEGWPPPGFPAKRNHACSPLVLRLARRNGSVRCGRVCSKIVYSVRIGPPQLEVFSFQLLRDTLQPSELTIRPAQRRQGRECETQSRR